MFKFTILCLTPLLVNCEQNYCGKGEIQRMYNNFEEFLQIYFMGPFQNVVAYDYTSNGQVHTLHLDDNGEYLTENFTKRGNKVETINGSLTLNISQVRIDYRKVAENKYEILYEAPTGNVDYNVKSLDDQDTSNYNTPKRFAVESLVSARKKMFKFFNALAENDVKLVSSIQLFDGIDFAVGTYKETTFPENTLKIQHFGNGTSYGSYICEGDKYDFLLDDGKVEDVIRDWSKNLIEDVDKD